MLDLDEKPGLSVKARRMRPVYIFLKSERDLFRLLFVKPLERSDLLVCLALERLVVIADRSHGWGVLPSPCDCSRAFFVVRIRQNMTERDITKHPSDNIYLLCIALRLVVFVCPSVERISHLRIR